jgi:hypothetical protein
MVVTLQSYSVPVVKHNLAAACAEWWNKIGTDCRKLPLGDVLACLDVLEV